MKVHPLVYILLVVLIFFITKWTIEGAYFRKDIVFIYAPLENLYGHIQHSGVSPFWAPELAGGYPLMATGQLGFWYPPHMLLRQFLPGVWTLNISLLFHAMLAAAGTFVFLRHYKMRSLAVAAGALLLPLGATFVGKYESLNLVLPLMWVPLILFFIQLFMESGKTKYFTIWIGANVFCLSSGHAQMALYALLLEAIFVCCVTGLDWRRAARALMILLGILLVVGLSSFHLLPILDNVAETDRASGTLTANAAGMFDYQFTPAAFWGLVLPHPFGHHNTYHGPTNENELSSYIGPIALVLAAIGLFTSRRKFPLVWWLAMSLVVIGLVLAVGGYSSIFPWLVRHGWNYFNAPARFFFYTHVGLVLLMVAGLDYCLAYLKSNPIIISLLLVSIVVPALWVSWTWNDGVPWKFTGEPALAKMVAQQTGVTRVFSGGKISDTAPDDDFGIKAWNPVCSTCVYRQSFTSPFNGMNGLAVKLSSRQLGDGVLTLRLYTKNGEQVRQSTIGAKDIIDSDWNNFLFAPLTNIADQKFYFELTSTFTRQQAPRLLIHTNPTQQYDPSGQLYNCADGNCRGVKEADAAFKIIVDSQAVEYYEALAPYVSSGFGIGSMQWAGSLPLASVKEYMKPLGTWGDPFGPGARAMINRFGTTDIIGIFPPYRYATDIDGVSLLGSAPLGDTFARLYRNDQAFPRLQFVQIVKALPNRLDQVNTLIRSDAADQKIVVADIKNDISFDTSRNKAQIIKDQRTQVLVQTEQKADGFLVLRDVLLKGWVATIDNQPVEIHRVDGIFRGVFVPAGNHVVAFQYKPPWLNLAVALELISMAFFAILVWFSIDALYI